MHLLPLLAAVVVAGVASGSELATFYNPILPGWNSDPSCIHLNGTFFCVTSTFIAFPGLPVYASKDLVNWRLISHAWSRDSQLPGVSGASWRQMGGMYAATLRHHEGRFYVIGEYLDGLVGNLGVLFSTTDPSRDEAWSDPVTFSPTAIDPDLFWDDDGKVHVSTQGCVLQEFNLTSGELSQPPVLLWNGTGGVWPEGPHIYKKDGWYYLLIAEGGTALDHAVTMARARNIWGPYEPSPFNPHLTNRGTDEYFQTVGHADLFQDADGNWWGAALATRSGPDYTHYPMGRETVLFPVTWEEGQWPVLQPVRGEMRGPLPTARDDTALPGPHHSGADEFDFDAESSMPPHFVHWRVPREETFSFTDKGLRIVPARANLTGVVGDDDVLNGQEGLAFAGRRQTHSLFTFSVDLDLDPQAAGDEAGVTVFLTQYNHIDLGLVSIARGGNASQLAPTLRLRVTSLGGGAETPLPVTLPVPESWADVSGPTRLQIRAVNLTHYEFSAMPAAYPDKAVLLGAVSTRHVSGGTGQFVGSLLGVYATCNGAGSGLDCPSGGGNVHVTRWSYRGEAQHISETEMVRTNK